jgi:ferredoxin
MAPRINEDNKAEVQSATCMGCGSCTAECPAKAITLRHFVDRQILAALESLLHSEHEQKTPELAYPAQAGVAPPRWQLVE